MAGERLRAALAEARAREAAEKPVSSRMRRIQMAAQAQRQGDENTLAQIRRDPEYLQRREEGTVGLSRLGRWAVNQARGTKLEDAVRTTFGTVESIPAGLIGGTWGMRAALNQAQADLTGDMDAYREAEWLRRQSAPLQNDIASNFADGSWGKRWTGAGYSAGATLPGLALSVATASPMPMAVMGAAQAGGDAYTEGRLAGASPGESAKHALVSGAAEGLGEYVGGKLLLPVMRFGGNGTVGQVAKRTLSAAAGEPLEEAITQTIQDASRTQFVDTDPDKWQQYRQSWANNTREAAWGGALGGILQGGMGHAMSRTMHGNVQPPAPVVRQRPAPQAQPIPDLSAAQTPARAGRMAKSPGNAVADTNNLIRQVTANGGYQARQMPATDLQSLTGSAAVERSVQLMIHHESRGNVGAQNKLSTAGGLGGFIDSTWLTMVKRYRPDIANGKSNAQIIALKTRDGALATEMTRRYIQENARHLEKSGLPSTMANLRLAHWFGAGGAVKLLNVADKNQPIANVVSAEVMRANPNIQGKTVQQVIDITRREMYGKAAQAVAGQGVKGGDGVPAESPALPERAEAFDNGMGDDGQAMQAMQRAARETQAAAEEMQEQSERLGRQTKVYLDNQMRRARLQLMEADELTPSVAGTDNQYRDRSRAASQMQINHIAQNLEPELLGDSKEIGTGAPTLANDGRTIIGGNGRVMGLAQAYDNGNGEGYRQYLMDNAEQFGLSREEIARMRKPVLVRQLDESLDIAKAAVASNEGGGLGMSALEQARADADRLPDFGHFTASEDGEINTAANRGFIRDFVGTMPHTVQAQMVDADGRLSQDGVRRLRNALLYRAYGNNPTLSRMVESTDQGARNLVNALVQAAPAIAQARDNIRAGNMHHADIAEEVVQAAEKLNQIREQGGSVADYLAQQGLFGEDMNAVSRELLAFFERHKRSGKAIATLLRNYYDALSAQGNPQQADVFGEQAAPDKQQLLRRTIDDYEQEHGQTGRRQLFERAGGRPAAEAVSDAEPQSAGRRGDEAGAGEDPRRDGRGGKQQLTGEDFRAAMNRGIERNLTESGTQGLSQEKENMEREAAEKSKEDFLGGYSRLIDEVESSRPRKGALDEKAAQRNHLRQAMEVAGFKPDGADGKSGFLDALGRFWDEQNESREKFSRSPTAEQQQFEETAQQYGGREAYEQAKENGETELDYRQWVQVRTTAFKEWFGDWENDLDNASKVVHPDTGEPLEVYHGSPNSFFVFDDSFSSTNTGNDGFLGRGFYFAKDILEANKYARGNENGRTKAYLSIKNPFRLTSENIALLPDWYFNEAGLNHIKRGALDGKVSIETISSITKEGRYGNEFRQTLEEAGFDGVTTENDPDKPEGIVYVAFRPNQIKSATDNSGAFDAGNDDIRYSRSTATQEKYEQRIDELFAGAKANYNGQKVLDRSDMLDMLGYGDMPLHLVESKVVQGMDNHPQMTAEVWKKIPGWVDKPVAVFESDTDKNRLVFIAPEKVAGRPVRIIIEPNGNHLEAHILVNAYDANSRMPWQRWVRDGLLKYMDMTNAHTVLGSSGLNAALPTSQPNRSGSSEAQTFRSRLNGMLTQSRGRTKILTEKNLQGYLKNNPALSLNHSGNRESVSPERLAQLNRAVERAVGKRNMRLIDVVSAAEAQRPNGAQELGGVEGWYDPQSKRITLIADNLPDERTAQFVAWHELGHRKIDVAGWQEWRGVLEQSRLNPTIKALTQTINRRRKAAGEAINIDTATEEAAVELYSAMKNDDYAALETKYGVDVPLAMRGGLAGYFARFAKRLQAVLARVFGIRHTEFGDTEVFELLRRIDQAEAAAAQRGQEPKFSRALIEPARHAATFDEARAQAKAFQGKPLTNRDSGLVAVASRNSLDKMLSRKAVEKSHDAALHALAVANVDRLYENAVYGWAKPDRNNDTNVSAIHRLFSVLETGNGSYAVKLTVKETARSDQSNKLYTIEAVELNEETPAASWVDSTVQADGLDPTSIRSVGDIRTLAQMAQDANQTDSNRPKFSRSENTLQEKPGWLDRNELGEWEKGLAAYRKIGELVKPVLAKVKLADTSPQSFTEMMRDYRSQLNVAGMTASEIAKTGVRMTPEERRLLSDILEKELPPGMEVSPEMQELAGTIRELLSRQGEQLADLGMLSRESLERFKDTYLPRMYHRGNSLFGNDDLAKMNREFNKAMRGGLGQAVGGQHLKGRGIFKTVSRSEQADYEAKGFELRQDFGNQGKHAGKVLMWRDYTREERARMGEERDAVLRFTQGYVQTQADLAKGVLFQRIAQNEELASKTEVAGWKQIPQTTIAGTGGVFRYGALAGMWVHPDVHYHLGQQFAVRNVAQKMWRSSLGWWKLTKTVYNPVAHMNNVVSNFSLLHIAGGRIWDLQKAAASIRNKDAVYREALEHGLVGEVVDSAGIRELFTGLNNTEDGAAATESFFSRVLKRVDRLALGVPGKISDKAQTAYRVEDEVFKIALYKLAREKGLSSAEARDYTLNFFFDYGEIPQGIKFVRDTGLLPFVSYTYKAIPAVLRGALTRPHRFLFITSMMYVLNALSYAMLGDAADEDEEREYMPEYMRGFTSFGTPKLIRLPWNDGRGKPMFIDVYRWLPLGDFADIDNRTGGLPLPQFMNPNGPLVSTYNAMVNNTDSFTGGKLVQDYMTTKEKTIIRAKWLAGQILPASVGMPFSYHSNNVLDGLKNTLEGTKAAEVLEDLGWTGKTYRGEDKQLYRGLLGAAGVKIRGEKPEDLRAAQERRLGSQIREVRAEIGRINRDRTLSPRAREAKLENRHARLQRLFAQMPGRK